LFERLYLASLKIQGNVKVLSWFERLYLSKCQDEKEAVYIAIMLLHRLSQALPGNAELAGVVVAS